MLCIYLKYWLYDQLIERQVNQDDFTSFFNHWNKQKNEKCSDCECEFPIKEFSEIIQIKSIYDVFLFWDSYNDKNKMNKVISNMEYCKYIDESKILYDLYKVMCKSDNNSLLCKEFNNYIIPHLKIDDNFNIICKMEEELDRNNLHGIKLYCYNLQNQNLKPSYEQSSKSVTHDLAPDSTNDGKSTGIIISSLSVGTVGFLFLLYKVNRRNIYKYEYYRVFVLN
ncbi:hypothetical protein PCYB_004040 [Plasmodium cynomolgi strain B]|uniref:CYIR protein n=1 Tax=Plasmodium cynomolgi (strain B) TaxID=1120755 RepID=K6V2X0_PLACD|nr:hypothetical protein PCYB_004040 [Plasmodium cynomolgi strain B]GAB69655.1 hypothetical protein PCYB_004040 [Plasmodium cynomolgi strain B]